MLKSTVFVLTLAFSVIGLSCGESRNTKIVSCSTNADIAFVNINPCNGFPCKLGANKIYNITINVTVHEAVTVGHVNLEANLLHTWVPYPGFEYVKFCDQLVGASCPLKAGQTVTYLTPLFFPKHTPLSLLPSLIPISWKVVDDKKNEILCFKTEIGVDKQ